MVYNQTQQHTPSMVYNQMQQQHCNIHPVWFIIRQQQHCNIHPVWFIIRQQQHCNIVTPSMVYNQTQQQHCNIHPGWFIIRHSNNTTTLKNTSPAYNPDIAATTLQPGNLHPDCFAIQDTATTLKLTPRLVYDSRHWQPWNWHLDWFTIQDTATTQKPTSDWFMM